MATEPCDVKFKQVQDHWEVYVDGEFFCSADNYNEAVDTFWETYNLVNN